MTTSRNGFYLNKTDGKLLGVCAGIADYTGVEAVWIRAALVVLTLLGWGSTIPLYLVVAFVAARRPAHLPMHLDEHYGDERLEARAYRVAGGRRHDLELRSNLSEIDRRVGEMERHLQVRD